MESLYIVISAMATVTTVNLLLIYDTRKKLNVVARAVWTMATALEIIKEDDEK